MKATRIMKSTLALLLLVSMVVTISGCAGIFGNEVLGDEWKEVRNVNVGYSKPYVRESELNNGDGYCDEFYIDIRGRGTDTGDEEGHYIYKNTVVTLNITIDGKDYTHRVPVLDDGSVSAYSANIPLKGDVRISKVESAYVRVAEVEGYRKKVPHTYEPVGETYPADCAKGPIQQHKCKECGGYKDEVLGEALGHKIGENGICSVCNRDFNEQQPDNSGSVSSKYIAAGFLDSIVLDLDISPEGLGTRTGTIRLKVYTDVALISGRGAESTKEQIIKINGVPQWDGDTLVISYTVMGYGEADILIKLFSNELNDSWEGAVHVTVFDE